MQLDIPRTAPRVYNGAVLYRGPSQIDGEPIVLIATGLAVKSTNEKTGAMIQTWILREDVSPRAAVNSGADQSVCGDCPSRGGACYVLIDQAPRNVWSSYHRGIYADMTQATDDELGQLFAGRVLRLGSYGNPSAVPFAVWRAATRQTAAVNGYDHMWRNPANAPFASLCMASVDSVQEREEAKALGWRTFRVRAENEPILSGEVMCPASKEAGYKTTCFFCRACGGHNSKAKADMVIMAHGGQAKKHHAKV